MSLLGCVRQGRGTRGLTIFETQVAVLVVHEVLPARLRAVEVIIRVHLG